MSLSSSFVFDRAESVRAQIAMLNVPAYGTLYNLHVREDGSLSRVDLIMSAAQVHQLHDVIDTWVRQNPLCSVETCNERATWSCESCAGANFCADHGIANSGTGCVVCEVTA